jgi:hypothetical protein
LAKVVTCSTVAVNEALHDRLEKSDLVSREASCMTARGNALCIAVRDSVVNLTGKIESLGAVLAGTALGGKVGALWAKLALLCVSIVVLFLSLNKLRNAQSGARNIGLEVFKGCTRSSKGLAESIVASIFHAEIGSSALVELSTVIGLTAAQGRARRWCTFFLPFAKRVSILARIFVQGETWVVDRFASLLNRVPFTSGGRGARA